MRYSLVAFVCLLSTQALTVQAAPKTASATSSSKALSTGAKSPVVEKIVAKVPMRKVTLRGRVLDPAGNPVSNARVFHTRTWNGPSVEKRSLADGRFAFEIEVPEEQKTVYGGSVAVWVPGWAIDGAQLTPDEVTEIRLQKPQAYRGVVKFVDGKVAAGVRVTAQHFYRDNPSQKDRRRRFMSISLPPELRNQLAVRSDAKGKWTIENLPLEVVVVAELDDERYVADAIQLGDYPMRTHLVAKIAGRIEGRIINANGKPVSGIQVRAVVRDKNESRFFIVPMNQSAVSDTKGQFSLSRLAPGKYNLLFGEDPYSYAVKATPAMLVAPALENVVVTPGASARIAPVKLLTPAIIQGRVLEASSGLPIPSLVYIYGPRQPRTTGTPFAVYPNKEGRYRALLPPGAQRIFVGATLDNSLGMSLEQSEAATGQSLTLRAGETRTLDFRVKAGPDLKGVVVDESGKPLAEVNLGIGKDTGSSRILTTDSQGRFEMKSLLPRQYLISVFDEMWELEKFTSEEYGRKYIAVNLPLKEPLRFVLKHRKVATIAGRVLDQNGKPLEKVKLHIETHQPDSMSHYGAQSGPDGTFSTRAPEAKGETTITARFNGYRWKSGGEITQDGANFRVADIILERLDGTASGRVLDANGQPVVGARVLSLSDEAGEQSLTNADGRFVLQQQPRGGIEVLAAWKKQVVRGKVEAQTSDVSTQLVELRLPVESPPSQTKLSQTNVELAQRFLNEVIEQLHPHEATDAVRRLAVIDPQTALDLALRIPKTGADDAREMVIQAALRNVKNVGWAAEQVQLIKNDEMFVAAAISLGLAQINNRDEATLWLQNAQSRVNTKTLTPQTAVMAAHLAALSHRLKMPESSRWLEMALAVRDRFPADVSTHSVIRPLARGGAELAEEATADQAAETQLSSLSSAMPVVARVDAQGAVRLLEKMNDLRRDLPGETAKTWQSRYAHAAKYVIFHLGPQNAVKAAELARTVDDEWNRPAALTMASLYGEKARRLELIGEAAEASTQGQYMTAILQARLAALSADVDAQAAENLFNESLDSLRAQNESSGRKSGNSDWAYYRATVDPAQARLELETLWLHEPEEPRFFGQRFSVPSRMAAIDLNRALEMLEELARDSGAPKKGKRALYDRTELQIAQYVLMSPLERLLVWNAGESGFSMEF